MAIKETLNNAVKHSEATELKLKIHWHDPRLLVAVEDNGKGFAARLAKSERNGLSNMANRMNELGGTCRVSSEPGKGCRVEFSIPVKQPRRSLWAWLWNAKQFPKPSREPRTARTKESSQSHDPTKC
jgi:nitrate/nitrite-specific signal transduction histidine kinase